MTVLLKNGSIDIFIQDGVIRAVGNDARIIKTADRVIDCTGLTVIPGICDMHVHLRDPGQTHKEDIFSGCEAAAAGGVTAVVCMPNTTPVVDTPQAVRDITERSKAAKAKVYPCAAITKGLLGKELTDFAALKAAGAVAVSDDGRPVENTGLMAQAMIKAQQAGLKIISHCEDLSLADSRVSENVSTMREIALADNLGVHIHIAHVSTQEALDYILIAKSHGLDITCEVAPHHFALTAQELTKRDADYKMNPPLRDSDDVSAIIDELCYDHCGIDCIASDHAPHTKSEKADFDNAPNGVLGLETLLAVTLTRLYHENNVPLSRIVELLCVNPRRILGIPGGELSAGSPADIAVIDLNEEWVVQPAMLCSKSQNSCFKGTKLKGRVKYTLVNGKIMYKN